MTQILKVHQDNPEKRHIKTACSILEKGKVILVPTETGYCYVADSAKESSHENFLSLRKNHPKNKPFSLACNDIAQVSSIAQLSTDVFRIANRIWPGPYTFILPANKNTPKSIAGQKRKSVGVRISSHPVIQCLIEAFSSPLLITSVTDEDELIKTHYFDEEVLSSYWWTNVNDIILQIEKNSLALALENDKPVPMVPSSVIDFTQDAPTLIRNGGHNLDFIGE